MLKSPVKDTAVTGLHAIIRNSQSPQTVTLMRVCSGQVENQVGTKAPRQLIESLFERFQIGYILASIGQLDIAITCLFTCREVLGTMQRQCKNRSVTSKDASGTISLVDIKINHGYLQSVLRMMGVLTLHLACCNSYIIEYAEPAATIRVRVMSATCQIRRNPSTLDGSAGG